MTSATATAWAIRGPDGKLLAFAPQFDRGEAEEAFARVYAKRGECLLEAWRRLSLGGYRAVRVKLVEVEDNG